MSSGGNGRRDGDGAGPRFTVLVPTYNQATWLPAALESLLAQRTPDAWEAVVVDDGSTDDTREVMRAYAARDARIRPVHKANGGVATALNLGLRQARGEWICWLSSDDLFEPDALATFAGGIAGHPACRFFHSDFSERHEATGRTVPSSDDRQQFMPEPALQVITFLRGNYVHGISICVHRAVFRQVGGFDRTLRYAQDVDMWLRISSRHPSVFLNRRTCVTRVHRAMGTTQFGEASPFDVARSAIGFLNAHPFPALFPWLDLRREDDLVLALKATLAVAATPEAYMYQGVGPVPALLDRFYAWWTNDCPAEFRAGLAPALRGIASDVAAAGLPGPIVAAFERLGVSSPQPFRYRSWNALAAMARNLADLEARRDPRAGVLRPYLERYRVVPAANGARAGEAAAIGSQGSRPATNVPQGSAPAAGTERAAGRRPDARYVNVAMVTYGRLEFTRQAIEALVTRTEFPYVLTVVDNGSTDGTRPFLEGLHAAGIVHNLVLLDENVGVARAANLAWSLEPGADWYLKLDNDVVVQRPGWLGDLVRAVDEVPELGAVAFNVEPVSYPLCALRGHRLRLKAAGNLGGACVLVPRRTRAQLGVWAEHYGPYGEEDADYCTRIRAAGQLIAYLEDEDAVFHLPTGKAAVIDPHTLAARDGVEEDQHASYRRWKDARRRENVSSGVFAATIRGYAAGTLPLRVESEFARAWHAARGTAGDPASL